MLLLVTQPLEVSLRQTQVEHWDHHSRDHLEEFVRNPDTLWTRCHLWIWATLTGVLWGFRESSHQENQLWQDAYLYGSGTLSSQVSSHIDKGPHSDHRSDREGCRSLERRSKPTHSGMIRVFKRCFPRTSKTLDDPLDNFPVYAVFINQYYWENTIRKVSLDP